MNVFTWKTGNSAVYLERKRDNAMKLNGIEYPVIGMVRSEFLRKEVPLLDIPMMSDERWNELAKEQNEKRKALKSSNE